MTSHDVVAIVRRRLGLAAVGHTGSLDPFATGLLVLVLGPATRLARFVAGDPKRYRATARLGWSTTTDDGTGDPVGEPWSGPWPTIDRVERALATMVGTVLQRPPAYSAKKIAGVRSYRLARGAARPEPASVEVRIDALVVEGYDPPWLELTAIVGPGTYVRSIARDLGRLLGTGAHLTALRRERSGPFDLSLATPLDRVDARTPCLPPLALLGSMPRVVISAEEAQALRHGRSIAGGPVGAAGSPGGGAETDSTSALVLESELVAIGRPEAGRWHPVVVLGAG
jgi:tRNA pseudouridine55 synthase